MKKMGVLFLSLLALSACSHGGGDSSAPITTRATIPAPGPEVPTVLKKPHGFDCPKDALVDYKYLRQICLKDTQGDFENCKKLKTNFEKKHSQLDCEYSDTKGSVHHIATFDGNETYSGTKDECAKRSDEMKSIENDARRVSGSSSRAHGPPNPKVVRHSKGDEKVETNEDLYREVFIFQDKYGTMKCDGESASAFIKEMQAYL